MTEHKHITKIVALAMALASALCLCAAAFSDISAAGSGISMEYEARLFDTSEIISVNILMDDSEWDAMLQNAAAEEYVRCDVEINGEVFYSVGIRPKGNMSLTSIVNDPTTDRYSLKLEFDRYVDGQTCFGLDKLVLNNSFADATGMKEALIYDMFAFLGADASLYNYARVSVNGEYWGLYLALEAVEDSFMLRNYGVSSGSLYKPEGVNTGAFSGGGADLRYTDDDPDSYSAIWDGAVTDLSSGGKSRVIAALKAASEGTEPEKYLDVDNLLRYMAVHVFSVNDDSLTGGMAHNYYLYESGGRLNIIPWDYNLALGGMGSADAAAVINDPVDGAFTSTDFFDALTENEAYYEQYHEYLRLLAEDYVNSGGLDAFYERTRGLIDASVEADPTAFYTYDEYNEAAEMLRDAVRLRAQSVAAQLDGGIPSLASQRQESDSTVDASGLDLSIMGTMNAGGQPSPREAGGGSGTEFTPGTPPDGADSDSFPGTPPDGGMGRGSAPNAPSGASGSVSASSARKGISVCLLCLAVCAAALGFALLYRRRPRR